MLEYEDIQGYVLSGYAHKIYSRFLFCQIAHPAQAQAWMQRLIPMLTSARKRAPSEPKPPVGVNLAFSVQGLRALGLGPEPLQTFSREFTGGPSFTESANPMATRACSELLGDTDESAPNHWDFGGPRNNTIHLILLLFGSTEAALESITTQAWGTSNGLTEIYRQHSNRSGDREAFGFHDGISQPAIEGSHVPVKPGQSIIKAGEFLLGYPNEYDQFTPSPWVPASLDPTRRLPPLSEDPSRHDLGRNGTYIAVRKLAQDIDGFWGFCREQARRPDGTIDEERQQWLASKMIGRWPSGAPMALCPLKDDPALGADPHRNNLFLYADDPGGLKCPVGAHLRRGNPRDHLPPDDAKTSLKVVNRHRLLRRGRPYNDDHGQEKGLMFMAINADISRQFEFVQQTWINSPKFGGLQDNKDPVLSDPQLLDVAEGGPTQSVMTIPDQPLRQRLHGLKRFVVVKGGGYFFMPGIRALHYLSEQPLPT